MSHSERQPRAGSIALRNLASAGFVLLIALRLFWVPAHVAFEAHAFDRHHDASSAQEDAARDHRDDGDKHAPHPIGDHLTELLFARAPHFATLVWLPTSELVVEPAPIARAPLMLANTESVPRAQPPLASRARAPPAS